MRRKTSSISASRPPAVEQAMAGPAREQPQLVLAGEHQKGERVRRRPRRPRSRSPAGALVGQPARNGDAWHNRGRGVDAFAGHAGRAAALRAATSSRPAVRSSSPAAGSGTSRGAAGPPGRPSRMSPRLSRARNALVGREQRARAPRACPADANASAGRSAAWTTGHAQFAHRGPQRLRHLRLVGERPEVRRPPRQFEQQAHHQRRTEPLFRRVDAALDEERRAHAERDVERRDEAEVRPVGALEHEPVAERAADGVRRHEHPLRARGMRAAELLQLVDEEGIHRVTTPV